MQTPKTKHVRKGENCNIVVILGNARREGVMLHFKFAMLAIVEKEPLYKIFIFAHASSKGGVIWKTKTLSKELPNSAI